MAKLSKGQANVLEALRSLPKRYRHFNRAGGLIKAEYVQVYDNRTLNALVARGWVRWMATSMEGDWGLMVAENAEQAKAWARERAGLMESGR